MLRFFGTPAACLTRIARAGISFRIAPTSAAARCFSTTSITSQDTSTIQIPFAAYRQLQLDHEQRSRQLHKEWRQDSEAKAAEIGFLKGQISHLVDDKLKLEQNFNVRGALERITYKATLENIIPSKPGGVGGGGGVQAKLDALAQLPDFAAIAEEEAGERGLDLDDILRSAQDLYHAVSKHAHGNDGIILVRTHEYSPEECAALVAYLRLQDGWSCPLAWEETREKVGPLKAAGTVGAMDTEGEE